MELVPVCSVHNTKMNVHELLECLNVAKEEHDEEDPINVQVPETQGDQAIEGSKIKSVAYTYPGHNFEELVFGIGNAQRDNKMGRFGSEVQSHIYI